MNLVRFSATLLYKRCMTSMQILSNTVAGVLAFVFTSLLVFQLMAH